MDNKNGLTLIELLVVMVILGILATIGFGQYKTSQIKARDAQRKGDLDNIARALEMYYNDNNAYPTSDSGLMQIDTDNDGSLEALNWGDAFETVDVIYMKILPQDPVSNYDYCYQSPDGTYFQLYAKLENTNDNDYYDYYICNTEEYYYGIHSSNTTLEI